jgi:hypothetical protein
MMKNVSGSDGLLKLFTTLGVQYRIYDMGRRVRPVSVSEFRDFENLSRPWATPIERQAWLAFLLTHNDMPDEQGVWFLRFPLDEQGYLVPAVMTDMLQQLLQDIDNSASCGSRDNTIPEGRSRYAYRPDQERLAMFHSLAGKALQRPPSAYYQQVHDYLSGRAGSDDWNKLGLQGLADYVVRLKEGDHERDLLAALPGLPNEVFVVVCRLLEHVEISTKLAQAVIDKGEGESLHAMVVRALSGCHSPGLVNAYLDDVLGNDTHADVLMAIAARHWQRLEDVKLAKHFLEVLAARQDEGCLFVEIMTDLLFMPALRGSLLAILRDPGRSSQLSRATGLLFGQVRPG